MRIFVDGGGRSFAGLVKDQAAELFVVHILIFCATCSCCVNIMV